MKKVTAKQKAQKQSGAIFGGMPNLGTLLAREIAPHLRQITEDTINALIDERIRLMTPLVQVQIIDADAERRKGQAAREGATELVAHPAFVTLLRLLSYSHNGRRTDVYLYGDPGGGKTTAARMAAEVLGLPYHYTSFNVSTPPHALLGYKDAVGTYHDTAFYRAYTFGGVLCLDELDNASGNTLTVVNGALENGVADFPCGQVERHPDCVIAATGNTTGMGATAQFSDRRPQDGASRERYFFLHWPADERMEKALTKAVNPKSDPWLLWVRKVRGVAASVAPHLIVSPRASFRGAAFLAIGLPPSVVADGVLWKGIDADTRDLILSQAPYPTADMSDPTYTEAADDGEGVSES